MTSQSDGSSSSTVDQETRRVDGPRQSHDDASALSFRARASRGERVLGTVVASPDLALAEMVATNFDFLWIDLEHSPLTVRDVQSLCIAARSSRCATLVRLPDVSS